MVEAGLRFATVPITPASTPRSSHSAAAALTDCGRVRGLSMTRSASEAGSEARAWEDPRAA
jgi:hypothetical protein